MFFLIFIVSIINFSPLQSVRAEIFMEDSSRGSRGNRGRGLRDNSPLECKGDFITMPAGFQPSFCIQCVPATPVTALAFRPSWGL